MTDIAKCSGEGCPLLEEIFKRRSTWKKEGHWIDLTGLHDELNAIADVALDELEKAKDAEILANRKHAESIFDHTAEFHSKELESLKAELAETKRLLDLMHQNSDDRDDRIIAETKADCEAELLKAKEELKDYKDSYESTLKESCDGFSVDGKDDRVHCTCVPGLRQAIEQLKEEIKYLRAEISTDEIHNGRDLEKIETLENELLCLSSWLDLILQDLDMASIECEELKAEIVKKDMEIAQWRDAARDLTNNDCWKDPYMFLGFMNSRVLHLIDELSEREKEIKQLDCENSELRVRLMRHEWTEDKKIEEIELLSKMLKDNHDCEEQRKLLAEASRLLISLDKFDETKAFKAKLKEMGIS